MTDEQALKLSLRIVCDEIGYPLCEARYTSVENWENETGCSFERALELQRHRKKYSCTGDNHA